MAPISRSQRIRRLGSNRQTAAGGLISRLRREQSLDALLSALARGIVAEFGAQSCRVYIYQQTLKALLLASHAASDDAIPLPQRLGLDASTPEAHAVRTGESCLVEHDDPSGSTIVLLLPTHSGLFGTLGATFADNPQPSDIDAFASMVPAISVLIEQLQGDTARTGPETWARVIAHDLKQPLSAIQMHATLLRRHATHDQAKHSVDHIVTSARLLSRMISDLDDTCAHDAAQLQLQFTPVDICALAHGVVQRLPMHEQSGTIRVQVHGEIPRVEVDPERCNQILINLLSNAQKYSYPHTEIVIDISTHEDVVELAVINSGNGISAEDRERVFRRFERLAASRSTHVPGLGLGLYITRVLVEAHGGRIWVESEPGAQTSFHFTLPLRQRAATT